MKRLKEEFVKILCQLEVIDKFKTNLENHLCNNYIIDLLNKEKKFRNFVAAAFPWKNTPEGSKFWKLIAAKGQLIQNKNL